VSSEYKTDKNCEDREVEKDDTDEHSRLVELNIRASDFTKETLNKCHV
jgi:hypothetical protein